MKALESTSSVLANIVLPVTDGALLVPNAAVAEVTIAGGLSSAIASSFMLGMLMWREQEIPVFSFEGLRDGELPKNLKIRHVAVLHGIGNRAALPFFAVALSGMPHIERLISADVEPLEAQTQPLIHSVVRVGEQRMMIPDWDYMEQQIMAALATAV
ncbi:chemotaxis protein CheW [Zhongshania sp.]|uniref:chemotaxis protein CheW n=1 Tax=Zhongshania sp. TaxID=1971902 RepID=UPI0035621D7F